VPAGFRVRRELMDAERLSRALSRIAHQIVERRRDAEGLVLVGVRTRGVPLARRLARLVAECAARPRAGLASADVGDGLTPVVDRYFGAIPAPAVVADGWEPAGYPHGTLMIARRRCLEEVGLFDERYFAYCEEAELALRAKAAGWQVGVVRGAEVRNGHVGNRAAVVDYLQLRNTLLMVREHSGRYHATIRLLIALWDLAQGAMVPAARGPYWAPRARVLAVAHHLRRRYGPPPPEIARVSAL